MRKIKRILAIFFGVLTFSGSFFSPSVYADVDLIHVDLADTTTVLNSSSNPASVGSNLTLLASVTGASGNISSGEITFKSNNESINGDCLPNSQLTLSNGQATCILNNLDMGGHSLSASYSGNASYKPSNSGVITQQIVPIATSITLVSSSNSVPFGTDFTLTATVNGNGSIGSVIFYDGTAIICPATTLVNEQAVCAVNNLSAGIHTLTAAYSGDDTHADSVSSTLEQQITKITTSTLLESTTNPAKFSENLVLIAAVTNNPTTGNMSFYNDASVICSNVPLHNGQASCEVQNLDIGSHHLMAIYNDDANGNYVASSSLPLSQVVIGPPVKITVISGTDQNTPALLTVQVTDAMDQPLSDITVTFNPRSSEMDAAALLAAVDLLMEEETAHLTTITNSGGYAQAQANSNNILGSYEISASVCSVLTDDTIQHMLCDGFDIETAVFNLTNE